MRESWGMSGQKKEARSQKKLYHENGIENLGLVWLKSRNIFEISPP